MKPDIGSREDIIKIVDSFYAKIPQNPVLAPVFLPTHHHLQEHLPRVYNFWDNMLFQTGSYQGGMMWVHGQVNAHTHLSSTLFEHWLGLFFSTIDAYYEGEKATFMKDKALEIGQIMHAKFKQINESK